MHITWHNFRFWKHFPTRKTEKVLTNAGLCAQPTVRPNKPKLWSLEQRKFYCRAMQGEQAPQIPNSPKGFSKALLKQGEGGAWLVVADFLVSASFVLTSVHVGQVMMFL